MVTTLAESSEDINNFIEHNGLIYRMNENKATLANVSDNFIRFNTATILSHIGESSTPVCSIQCNAFKDLIHLKTVIFPNTIETIHNSCFKNCVNLTKIKLIHTKLKFVSDYCFKNCFNLVHISLPMTVQYIGKSSFKNCIHLKNVEIPQGKISISLMDSCFMNCTNLQNLAFLSDANMIEAKSFSFCRLLSNIVLSDKKISKLSSFAFYKCASLREITITKSVKIIDEYCFAESGLIKFTLPSWIEYVGPYILINCSSLLEIEIKNSIISEGMVFGCLKLSNILMSDALTKIGKHAFQMTRINRIVIPSKTRSIGRGAFLSSYLYDIDLMKTQITKIKADTFRGCAYLNTVFLNQNTVSLGQHAFKDSGISKITNTANIKQIGVGCFENTSLISVEFDSMKLREIPMKCFAFSNFLEFVSISESVTSIGYQAFKDTGIKCFNFEYVKNIGDELFQNCKNLNSVQIAKLYYISKSMFNGCVSLGNFKAPITLEYISENAFLNSGIECFEIGERVNFIGPYAFANCNQLKKVIFATNLITELSEGIFYNSSLQKFVVPRIIKKLGNKLLAYSKISELSLHENVTLLPPMVCKNCCYLFSIVIPKNIEIDIQKRAFFGCTLLKNINFSCVSSIGKEAFFQTSITEFKPSNSLSLLGPAAFAHSQLKTIDLTEGISLRSIPRGCFMCCSYLFYVTFGPSIRAIGRYSFMLCPITHVIFDGVLQVIEPASFIWLPRLCLVDLSKTNLTRLSRAMFVHCHSLKNITLPLQVEDADEDFIIDCHALEFVEYHGANAPIQKILKQKSFFVGINFKSSSLFGATNAIRNHQEQGAINLSDLSLMVSPVYLRFIIRLKNMQNVKDGDFDLELVEKVNTNIGDVNIKKELLYETKINISNKNKINTRLKYKQREKKEQNQTIINENNTSHENNRSNSNIKFQNTPQKIRKVYFQLLLTFFILLLSFLYYKSINRSQNFEQIYDKPNSDAIGEYPSSLQ